MTRAQCLNGPRPCPHITCRYHLGSELKTDTQPIETCCLDVADRRGATLEEVGTILGVTRERIRQIELRALNKLRRRAPIVAQVLDLDSADLARWPGATGYTP